MKYQTSRQEGQQSAKDPLRRLFSRNTTRNTVPKTYSLLQLFDSMVRGGTSKLINLLRRPLRANNMRLKRAPASLHSSPKSPGADVSAGKPTAKVVGIVVEAEGCALEMEAPRVALIVNDEEAINANAPKAADEQPTAAAVVESGSHGASEAAETSRQAQPQHAHSMQPQLQEMVIVEVATEKRASKSKSAVTKKATKGKRGKAVRTKHTAAPSSQDR